MIIKSTIMTEGPLSISLPAPQNKDRKDMAYDGFPVMARGEGRTGYLPATTLRGSLRRGATLALGGPQTLPEIYMNMIGQVANVKTGEGFIDTDEIARQRDENPIVDLFGAGMSFHSRIRVSHFLPEEDTLPHCFRTVRKDLDDTDGALDLLSDEDRERFLTRSETNSNRAATESLVKKLRRKLKKEPEVAEELAAAEELAEKLKGDMGDLQESSKHLPSHWGLPMGLALNGKIVVQDWKDRDMGIIMDGLNALSLWPIIGANSARGCGEISGTFKFYDNGALIRSVSIGGFEKPTVVDF